MEGGEGINPQQGTSAMTDVTIKCCGRSSIDGCDCPPSGAASDVVLAAEKPLTASELADALGCFWNAALQAHRDASYHGDSPQAMLAGIVEGVQAVATRLTEIAALTSKPE